MDITVGEDFLGVFDQNSSCQRGSYSQQLLWCRCSLTVVNTPQWNTCITHRVVWYATRPWTAGRWCKQIPGLSLHFCTHQPSGKMCGTRVSDFWEPSLSRVQCISRAFYCHEVKLRDLVYQIFVFFFILLHISSVILTSLCWVASSHNSVTIQIHMLTNFYDHRDLGNHLLQLCPQLMEHCVNGNINIRTLTYFLCFSLNSTVHTFAAMFKVPQPFVFLLFCHPVCIMVQG